MAVVIQQVHNNWCSVTVPSCDVTVTIEVANTVLAAGEYLGFLTHVCDNPAVILTVTEVSAYAEYIEEL